jgi:uncharacterized membrane-anchored protein
MREERSSRLEHWTRRITETSLLIRAVVSLIIDLTELVNRSRSLVIAITLLMVTVAGSLALL